MAQTRKTKTSSKAAESSAPKRATRAKAPAATHAGTEGPASAAAARKTAPRRRTTRSFDPALHHEEIAREAYLLWLSRGMEHGRDQEDWHRAVEIVRSRHTAAR